MKGCQCSVTLLTPPCVEGQKHLPLTPTILRYLHWLFPEGGFTLKHSSIYYVFKHCVYTLEHTHTKAGDFNKEWRQPGAFHPPSNRGML